MADLEQELRDKIKQAHEEAFKADEAQEAHVEPERIEDTPAEDEKVSSEAAEETGVEPTDETSEESGEAEESTEAVDSDSKDGKKFQHMRLEAKENSRVINDLRERLARMEGRQDAQQQPEKKEVVVEIPDRDLEPDAWMDHQLAEKDKRFNALEEQVNAFSQQASTTHAEQVYADLESKYSNTDASYSDAKTFLYEKNASAIREQYPSATDAQIKTHLNTEEHKLVSSLAKAGCSSEVIFQTIKAQAVSQGYTEIAAPVKRDKEKLKRNMSKSANLNDAPAGNGDLGFSSSQMSRMKSQDFHALMNNPKDLKKAKNALMIARIKASG